MDTVLDLYNGSVCRDVLLLREERKRVFVLIMCISALGEGALYTLLLTTKH